MFPAGKNKYQGWTKQQLIKEIERLTRKKKIIKEEKEKRKKISIEMSEKEKTIEIPIQIKRETALKGNHEINTIEIDYVITNDYIKVLAALYKTLIHSNFAYINSIIPSLPSSSQNKFLSSISSSFKQFLNLPKNCSKNCLLLLGTLIMDSIKFNFNIAKNKYEHRMNGAPSIQLDRRINFKRIIKKLTWDHLTLIKLPIRYRRVCHLCGDQGSPSHLKMHSDPVVSSYWDIIINLKDSDGLWELVQISGDSLKEMYRLYLNSYIIA